jgi:hypothetical protein
MTQLPRLVLAAAALLVAVIPGADGLLGQDLPRKSEIRGTVVQAADRQPIAGARVSLEGTPHSLVTDRKGRFKFPKVAAGEYLIRAEVEGFPAATTTLRIARDERLDVEFQVGDNPAVALPELVVDADVPPVSPIREFNRRATTGGGRYITRDFIEKRRAPSIMDLLRSVPGVRIVCPRTARVCSLHLTRHREGCGPAYFVDGVPADPAVLWLMNPNDLEGVELYSGAAETPPELEGVRSACGAIVLWTRVGEKPG